MTISNEAVEAAAKALYFYLDEDHRGQPDPWESLAEDDEGKIDAKEAASIALEAAASIIRAECLGEAADAILTNDPLDYWAGHLPEGLGFQEAMSRWLKAHAKAIHKEGK